MIRPMQQPHITLFGIPNCDTVRKARNWLEARDLPYTFHDFKKQGIEAGRILQWCEACGIDKVLNRKGTTWRGLAPVEQEKAATLLSAIELLKEHPSLIKRPVVEWKTSRGSAITVGFDADDWEKQLK